MERIDGGVARLSRRGFLAVPLAAVAAVAARWSDALGQAGHIVLPARARHPEPRTGITAEKVLPPEKLPDRRRVRRAFEMAREIPQIFDGLYCHCDCEKSHGHRSLLSCFESDQAIGCLACREEAELAYRLYQQGKTLDQIRLAVDAEME